MGVSLDAWRRLGSGLSGVPCLSLTRQTPASSPRQSLTRVGAGIGLCMQSHLHEAQDMLPHAVLFLYLTPIGSGDVHVPQDRVSMTAIKAGSAISSPRQYMSSTQVWRVCYNGLRIGWSRRLFWSNEMIPRVETAQYKGDFIVHIRFSDGTEGDVDLRNELFGEIFEPLKDQSMFAQVGVHPEFHTLVWQNGADFAPEFLYEKLRVSV